MTRNQNDVYLGAAEARALIGRWRGGGGRGFGGGEARPVWGGEAVSPVFGEAERHREHEVRKEEWERRHPGEDWWERERRRREWERQSPGVPFVGAEAVVDATKALMGAAAAGNASAAAALGELGIAPAAILAPAPAPTQAQRQGLPMNSGQQTFAFSDTALITSRPQRPAFRPERVFISPAIGATAGAAAWFVNDITIGNVSQLVQSGGLPGDMFANQSIDSFVTFATAQTAMDVTMSITLIESGIEPNPAFYGGIIGTSAT